MATDAQGWLRDYLQRNRRQMTAAQIRIVSTAARQCGSERQERRLSAGHHG